jgi:hypothetical protein
MAGFLAAHRPSESALKRLRKRKINAPHVARTPIEGSRLLRQCFLVPCGGPWEILRATAGKARADTLSLCYI